MRGPGVSPPLKSPKTNLRNTMKTTFDPALYPKFRNKDGTLTGYSFACGYVERYGGTDTPRATISREVAHDPALALFSGEEGLDLIRRFIPEAFHHLKPGGWLVLEIGHDQASQVAEILQTSAFTAIEVKTDLSGVARFPFARRS